VKNISYTICSDVIKDLHIKFLMLSPSGSLVTKVKYRFHAATTLLFYIMQKSCTFFEYLLLYIMSRPYIKRHFHLTSSCVHHVFITDSRKL